MFLFDRLARVPKRDRGRDRDDPSHRIAWFGDAAGIAAKWRRGGAGWSARLEYRLVGVEDQPAVRIASLEGSAEREDDPADLLPDLPMTPPVTQIGDIWHLDNHVVACADALDPAAFARLMGAERAALVFTDPQYNVPIDGHVGAEGRIAA